MNQVYFILDPLPLYNHASRMYSFDANLLLNVSERSERLNASLEAWHTEMETAVWSKDHDLKKKD